MDTAAGGGVADKLCEAAIAGFRFNGANNPPCGYALIPRRLRFEIFPRFGIRAKEPFLSAAQFAGFALIGIALGAAFVTRFKNAQTVCGHAFEFDEFLYAADVDDAPVAFGFSRCKADCVNTLARAFADAVNPTET